MFKKLTIITFAIITFFLSACSVITNDIVGKIKSPTPKETEITGTWKIKSYLIYDTKIGDNNEGNKLVNTTVSFGTHSAFIDDNYVVNPRYKLKIVNYYNKYINVENKDVPVISVTDGSNGFCDFIKTSDNSGYIIFKGLALKTERISTKAMAIDDSEIAIKEQTLNFGMNEYYNSPVGVLIGLKTPRISTGNNSIGEVKYRTIWIKFDGSKLESLKEKEDLLVPRLKGFWNLSEKSIKYNNKVIEEFQARQINRENEDFQVRSKTTLFEPRIYGNLYREILFVGNDYVSTEYYSGENFDNNYNKYQILPMDNIKSTKGIDIKSLLGEEAVKAYDFSKELIINDQNKMILDNLNVKKSNYENYAMIRRNGHWVLQGKIEGKEADKNGIDFYINFQPTKKLVNYDTLYVSWNRIKEAVPSARDAYTSPNERLALIINKEYLYIYEINQGNLIGEPIQRIKLNTGETVVMAEWAYGDYVDKWDKVMNSFKETKDMLK